MKRIFCSFFMPLTYFALTMSVSYDAVAGELVNERYVSEALTDPTDPEFALLNKISPQVLRSDVTRGSGVIFMKNYQGLGLMLTAVHLKYASFPHRSVDKFQDV